MNEKGSSDQCPECGLYFNNLEPGSICPKCSEKKQRLEEVKEDERRDQKS